MNRRLWLLGLILTAAMINTNSLPADEGLWLFNHPPKKLLKEKHGFNAPPEWYEHLQKSSVRFNTGGSGSFVSADGLVMTNHHVGLGTLQKLSRKGKDYVKDGFYARTLAEEFKSVDEELNVLMDIVDVTARVKAAVTDKMTPEQAFEARRGIIAKIEEESYKRTGLRSNVVTLYNGGQYHLYRYKVYDDVRLVFARSSRPPSTAATRTTSPTRALTSIAASSGFTRTASRPRFRTSSSGARRASTMKSWYSSPAIPATRTASTRWPTSNTSAMSCTHSSSSASTGWK